MRAVVVDHDAPAHVSLRELPDPEPGPGEAVVAVEAVSLNLGELRYAQSREAGSPIGWDLAGVVEHAAADGRGPRAGERVVGFVSSGAWAQLAAVSVDALAVLPEDVSYAQAATLPVAGITALQVVEKASGLLGRRALVTGANGGVGLFACQLAKLAGATVVALVRREQNADIVRQAAADRVVVSEDGSGASEHAPYRLVAESVGGAVLSNVLHMLDEEGICVTYGASANPDVMFNIWPFMRTGRARLYGYLLFNELAAEPASVNLARLAEMLSQGHLKTFITRQESWENVSQVALDLWERRIAGKAVLNIE